MIDEPKTLLEGKPYVPAKHTDIRETWKKFGWTPKHPPGERLPDTTLIFQSRRCN